jgi:hypothetical protein
MNEKIFKPSEEGIPHASSITESAADLDDIDLKNESVRREKIEINKDLSTAQIMEEYGCSRATAWRAKNRGWLFTGYHTREVAVNTDWASDNIEEIQTSANIGVRAYLKRLSQGADRSISELCAPLSPEDFIQEAVLRLVELSDHPDRNVEGWRVMVARHACQDLLAWNSQRERGRKDLESIEVQKKLVDMKQRLSDIVPEEILEIAARYVSGKQVSSGDLEKLEGFKNENFS